MSKLADKIQIWLQQLLNTKYEGKELADMFGCHPSQISRIKNGKRRVTDTWVDMNKSGLLALAMTTGNTEMRNMIVNQDVDEREQEIDLQIATGGIVVPMLRKNTVNPNKVLKK